MVHSKAHLEDPLIQWFLKHAHEKSHPSKSILIKADTDPDTLFYIVEGSVTVLIENEDGQEIVLAYLNAGDFFGELGLFDNLKRSAWVRAKTTCRVAHISYTRFEELIRQEPGILMKITAQIAMRLRNTSRKVGDLAFMDVTGRIARTLLDLAKEPDALTHPDGMQIKVTRQEIGRIVGCSREMAGRVLKNLEEQGLIAVSGKTMVIHNTR